MCCSIRVNLFVKGTSVLFFGFLNVTTTIDCAGLNFLILCVENFVVVETVVVNKRFFIHSKSLCI